MTFFFFYQLLKGQVVNVQIRNVRRGVVVILLERPQRLGLLLRLLLNWLRIELLRGPSRLWLPWLPQDLHTLTDKLRERLFFSGGIGIPPDLNSPLSGHQ